MGYMERLGLWGEGSPFAHFTDFLDVIGSRGVGALEMVAMDMKARGMYVCRTLSFAGVLPDFFPSISSPSRRLRLNCRVRTVLLP